MWLILVLWLALMVTIVCSLIWSLFHVLIVCLVTLLFGVLFLGFPDLVIILHTKPLYLEDIENNTHLSEILKIRFHDIFIKCMAVFLSLSAGLICEYVIYKYDDRFLHLSVLEILALIGGLLSIYRELWNNMGKLLLLFIDYRIRRQERAVLTSPYTT